jgi:hypothetical protein
MVRGGIFLVYDPVAKKDKFWVFFGADGDTLCFVRINSNPYTNYISRTEAEYLNVKLKQEDYSSFLVHDSYLDCNTIHSWERSEFAEHCDPIADYRENLLPSDLEQALRCLSGSRTITPKAKKRFNLIIVN